MATIHDDDRFAPTHLVEVVEHEDSVTESAFDRSAERWRAECSCGWAGDWHPYPDEADADGEDHREIAVGPSDGLDVCMSGLLDLQDDLAQVVMWLAENWSADLPVPASRGDGTTDEGAGVHLMVYCLSSDDLERAASLLGVPLVDDSAPDCYGYRYRRAVRRFGRVRVDAYRTLAPVCDECGTALAADGRCPVHGERVDAGSVTAGAA